MAKTPEGKLKEELDEYLDSLGPDCWYFKPMSFGYGRNGIPDYIICYKGYFLAPETKKEGGKSQPWQEREQEAIRAAGGISGRIRPSELEQVKTWVRYINSITTK